MPMEMGWPKQMAQQTTWWKAEIVIDSLNRAVNVIHSNVAVSIDSLSEVNSIKILTLTRD